MTLPVDILSFYHYKEPIRLYIKSIVVELKIWRTYLCQLEYLDAWLEKRCQILLLLEPKLCCFLEKLSIARNVNILPKFVLGKRCV